MTLKEIAKAVRGTLNGRWIRVAGPGHRPRDDSLGFKLDPRAPDGFWTHSFAGDPEAECRAHVRKLLTVIRDGGSFLLDGEKISEGTEQNESLARAERLWCQAQAPEGSPVETYLRTRGCQLQPSADSVLRFHPACPFGRQHRFPAMIALLRDVATGAPRGIQRTALSDCGTGKRKMPDEDDPRKMLGSPKGAAVMLCPKAECIGIGEGIETSLSARQVFDTPIWAALSAAGVATFPIIPGIKHLTILADYDSAGLQAARKCALRYKNAGIEVEVRCPPVLGDDWNDYVCEVNNHAFDREEKQACKKE